MTGMEQMANTLVKGLTGMSIDEVKAAATQAYAKVAEVIETFNANFKVLSDQNTLLAVKSETTATRIDQLRDEMDTRLNIVVDRLDIALTLHNAVLAATDHIIRLQENQLAHIAQISVKLGLDLGPDLLEVLTRQATAGTASEFTIPDVLPLPDPLVNDLPKHPTPIDAPDTFELDGVGLGSSSQPQPADIQSSVVSIETKAGDVIHARHSAAD